MFSEGPPCYELPTITFDWAICTCYLVPDTECIFGSGLLAAYWALTQREDWDPAEITFPKLKQAYNLVSSNGALGKWGCGPNHPCAS
eukprot:gene9778-biopygen15307